MAEDPNASGRAVLIPSYTLDAGRLRSGGGGLWGDEPDDPAELAAFLLRRGSQRIHVCAERPWSAADLAALAALATRQMFVLAEGHLDSRQAITDVVAAGVKVVILDPALLATEREWLWTVRVGVLGVVGSPRTSPTIAADMRAVLDGQFEGVVTAETTETGVDIASMLGLISALQTPTKPLIIARLLVDNPAEGLRMLQTMQPLNVTMLVDGGMLLDLVRVGRSQVVVERIGGDDTGD